MSTTTAPNPGKLTTKDFASNQDVKWCPGCGDYSILKQVQTIFPDLGIPKEQFAFVSGIGCSSRFPYYMDTYGMHSIHGRAFAVATGLKLTRPDLSVWVVTGDGDALSIGGNHFIHVLRRNPDLNILLFNNEIYGLTKGQYSPTSEVGKVTKSTPFGSLDFPFNPSELVLGAKGTFFARTMDRDPKHMQMVMKRAHTHKGTSMVEIYQNCPVFNDGAFFTYTEKDTKKSEGLFVENGKPLVFGSNEEVGVKLDGLKPVIVNVKEGGVSLDDLWIHDERDKTKATLLARFFADPKTPGHLPRPFGIFYVEDRPCYDELVEEQLKAVTSKKGTIALDKILSGSKTWMIQ
jgi:2-oxoglutarate/2-oxoacid ferredoxin oxidoreductase subunit beta